MIQLVAISNLSFQAVRANRRCQFLTIYYFAFPYLLLFTSAT